jgi:hypothetical protein
MFDFIDIKTGKAAPWAALQLAAYSLLDSADVEFDEATHTYSYNGFVLPSVTQILQAEGFVNTAFYDEWSRNKGSMVHLAVKYYLSGELDEETLDPEIVPYLTAFKKFMRDSRFQFDEVEQAGRNTTWNYAGTYDLRGHFPVNSLTHRYALELHNDEKYKLIPFSDRNDKDIFLSAVACHTWKKNNLRR